MEMMDKANGTMVVDGAVELHRDLGYRLNFGEALMLYRISRSVRGTMT